MQGAPDFAVVVTENDGTSVVNVKGELDIFTAPRLSSVLSGLVDAGRDVVVALGDTAFMESTGIAVLAQTHFALEERGGHLTIDAPRHNVFKVLELSGLTGIIEITHPPSAASPN
ncbi:MAG TPA: STAS domain-containing protein [Acidimicrobiales bacterium]|nr:STAS domain-containing protein [Acidimicrobiales bacterium]